MSRHKGRVFVEQACQEGIPIGALVVRCRNRGLVHAAAVELAEEAAAEAYTRSLDRDFESYVHYCNWLTRTALNWAIDRLRRRRPVRAVRETDCWVDAVETLGGMEEDLLHLREVIALLPVADQEVLRLAFFEQLTLEKMADRLEPNAPGSLNARRLRMKRKRDVAIERLRCYLEGQRREA